ncbi:MAG: hypothetical protein EOM50_05465 [Erysipelotrichia bacterium]|nr:hypothetical protein [Erysipelotrichia bacterium]NCC53881.1 hypothetical protein [Erysipelotrichia bacterium]
MQQIQSFEEVLYGLKNREIFFIIDHGKATFFAQIDVDKIRVNNENVNYFIDVAQFIQLFKTSKFYQYERSYTKEELVCDEKDAQYYSWWHK